MKNMVRTWPCRHSSKHGKEHSGSTGAPGHQGWVQAGLRAWEMGPSFPEAAERLGSPLGSQALRAERRN